MSDLIPDNTKIAISILEDIIEHGPVLVMKYQDESIIKEAIATVLKKFNELHSAANTIESYLNARKDLEYCLENLKILKRLHEVDEDNHR